MAKWWGSFWLKRGGAEELYEGDGDCENGECGDCGGEASEEAEDEEDACEDFDEWEGVAEGLGEVFG